MEQIHSEGTWPIGRSSEDFKKEIMAGKAVLRPVFIGCYDDEQFKEEFKLFKLKAVDIAPDNKWWIVRVSTGTNDIGFSGQGPYTLEGCLADFYELQTGGETILAGCVTDSVRETLADITYQSFNKKRQK